MWHKYLLRLLGFRMEGMELLREYPKSVVTMAPHTAYREAIYGKWALQAAGVKYVFCSKNEYFSGPMKLAMRYIGAMPVRNVPGKNSIFEVTKLLQNKQLHVVICPEGGFAPTHTWQDGFYYMACRANVPILVGAIDFKKRVISIKGVIIDLSDKREVYRKLHDYYDGVTACYPKRFLLPLNHEM